MSQQSTAETRAHVPMTLAAWAEMEEDAPGEFVDGEIVEDEDMGAEHDVIGAWLIWTLRSWLASRGGIIGMSDTRFGVSSTRGRKPDTYVYLGDRKPPRRGLVTVPPDIMVEVVSPRPSDARRDRVEKMREYAAFGVKFYWIVDPAIRTFEILELGEACRYEHAVSATEGTIDQVPGCNGLVLDLDALWAEVDQLDVAIVGGE
jgi:Uma2 family endonuclease